MKKVISNWGNFPKIEADDFEFTFDEDLEKLVHSKINYISRGNGRCYGDASLSETTLTTTKYDKILYFDDALGEIECQSGILLGKILEVIVPKGWFLPVTPGTKLITLGGAVASDVHGKNHHVDGCFSNHVISMEVLLSSGQRLICSESLNQDLFLATCGGMGLTGIITKVKFRLKKIESSYILQKQIKAKNLEELISLFDSNKHSTYSVAWIDCLKKGKGFGRSILMLGEHATLEQLSSAKAQTPLKVPKDKRIKFPFYLPTWVLNTITVKLFNTFFYNKFFSKERMLLTEYEPFFYPLDSIIDWNKGYGKKGFIQYQFVLPLSAKEALVTVLEKLSANGIGSFLAVLKVFGKQNGLINFPKEGYTLALDIPVRKNLFKFLTELDTIVISNGGRLYMSKDARMSPESLRQGYECFSTFETILKKYDPERKICSKLSERLNINTNL